MLTSVRKRVNIQTLRMYFAYNAEETPEDPMPYFL